MTGTLYSYRFWAFLFIAIGFSTGLQAQDFSLFEKHTFIKGTDSLPYRVLLPAHVDKHKKYPLVIFLHGAGERGNDNEKQLTHGAKLFLENQNREHYPAIVVFPQCPEKGFWSNVKIDFSNNKREFNFSTGGDPTPAMQLVLQLTGKLFKDYPVNKNRVYVMG